MKKYDFEVSKRKLIISGIIFVVAAIWAVTRPFVVEYPLLYVIGGMLYIGFLAGGFPYGWFMAKAIMAPRDVNEVTGERYHGGGVNGIAMQFAFGVVAGLVTGGILFAIDIIRTIIYLVQSKQKNA